MSYVFLFVEKCFWIWARCHQMMKSHVSRKTFLDNFVNIYKIVKECFFPIFWNFIKYLIFDKTSKIWENKKSNQEIKSNSLFLMFLKTDAQKVFIIYIQVNTRRRRAAWWNTLLACAWWFGWRFFWFFTFWCWWYF